MPRVPVYDRPTEATQPLRAPEARISPEGAFGENVGQALQRTGQAVQGMTERVVDFAQKARRQAMEFRAQDAEVRAGRAAKELLYGQNGYMLTQGENALDTETVHKALADAVKKVGEYLPDDAKVIFEQRMAARLADWDGDIEHHAGQQREGIFKNGAEGATAEALDEVGLHYTEPKRMQEALTRAAEATVRYLRYKGVPEAKMGAVLTDLREEGFERALKGYIDDGDSVGARAFYEKNKDQLGSRASKYAQTMVKLERAEKVEVEASRIMAESKPAGYSWVDVEWADSAVDAWKGPAEDKEALRAEVQKRVAANVLLQKRAVGDHLNAAVAWYEKSGSLSDPRVVSQKEWLLDPQNGGAEEWMKFENGVRRRNRALRGAKDPAKEQRKLNAEAYRQYRLIPKEDVSDVSVDQEFAYADEATRGRLRTMQSDDQRYLDGGGRAKRQNVLDMVKASMGEVKLNPAQQKRAEALALDEYESWRTSHEGRDPTTQDAAKFAAKGLEVVKVPGVIYGTNETIRAKVKPGQKIVGEEPPAAAPPPRSRAATLGPTPEERKQIEDALRQTGREVTPAAIISLWKKVKGG